MTMVALGLEDRIVGMSYPASTEVVPTRWREAYQTVPVLSEEYLSKETFLAAKPDFAYATSSMVFSAKYIGTCGDLAAHGIPSYLSVEECWEGEYSWDLVWQEIADIGRIFGVPGRAEELVPHQRQVLQRIRQESPGAGIELFVWDMNTKTLLVVAGGGGPQLILDAVGAGNISGHLDKEGWATVSWEQVVAANPGVIVVTEAPWSSAQKKIAYLESDPALSQLTAVKKQRYVTVSYSAITSFVRLVGAPRSLGRQLAEFDPP